MGNVTALTARARPFCDDMQLDVWIMSGKKHRIEGPAEVYWSTAWFLEGVKYDVTRPWQRRGRRLRWLLNL